MTSRTVTVVNQLGLHARAAARFVHLATRFESQIRVARDTKVMDGKSIMGILLLAAARGTTITISADGAGRSRRPSTRWRSWSNPDLVRNRGTPERHRRLGRHGRRPGAGRHPAHAGHPVSDRARSRGARAVGARARARCARTSSSSRSAGASPSSRAPTWPSIFDAQLLMLDDPMLRRPRRDDRAATSASTPNGRCSARSTSWPPSSTTSTIRICTSARATCTTSPAACA